MKKVTGPCSVDGCEHPGRLRRGLCPDHYERLRSYGRLEKLVPPGPLTAVERLASETVRTSIGCLEWVGPVNPGGYGYASFDGKSQLAHRVSWELANGPIPDGLDVCHHCDNPPCCETEPTDAFPDGHLFLGTDLDNMRDMYAKGRSRGQKQTHCKSGHEFTPENTGPGRRGSRYCRTCMRIASVAASRAARDLAGPVIYYNAMKTHCKHGHPFDEANTYLAPRGTRECRTCKKAGRIKV